MARGRKLPRLIDLSIGMQCIVFVFVSKAPPIRDRDPHPDPHPDPISSHIHTRIPIQFQSHPSFVSRPSRRSPHALRCDESGELEPTHQLAGRPLIRGRPSSARIGAPFSSRSPLPRDLGRHPTALTSNHLIRAQPMIGYGGVAREGSRSHGNRNGVGVAAARYKSAPLRQIGVRRWTGAIGSSFYAKTRRAKGQTHKQTVNKHLDSI